MSERWLEVLANDALVTLARAASYADFCVVIKPLFQIFIECHLLRFDRGVVDRRRVHDCMIYENELRSSPLFAGDAYNEAYDEDEFHNLNLKSFCAVTYLYEEVVNYMPSGGCEGHCADSGIGIPSNFSTHGWLLTFDGIGFALGPPPENPVPWTFRLASRISS